MKYVIKGIKPHEIYSGEKIIELLRDVGIEISPEVRKYDWGKTLDDVLVIADNGHIYPNDGIRPRGLYTGWQSNIHGKCPVDPRASIVRVRFMDGDEEESLARNFTWEFVFHPGTIISWQFIRLAEGYEW